MEEPSEIENWSKISILGSGGFGTVSLWQNKTTFDYIAIKKCKFQLPTQLSDKQRKRWENEVNIMRSLHHRNIVAFKQLPTELENNLSKYNPTKLPLLSMEYCKQGNLRHVLNQTGNCCGLPEQQIKQILKDVTAGLSHLHNLNITHRDIKPENIVLQDDGPSKIIYKIIDLGYAKELNDATVSFVGTLNYLAPEIIKTETYNSSVDYWSLGVLAFEIICGVQPFLPFSTPFERFRHIEKKKKDHICIYKPLQSSENIVYSSELMKENHISTCLQNNLQIWLKHVLDLDPTARSQPFPDKTPVFQYLTNTLNKQIISVFSVYTLEFYSYEINEGTLIATLKNWIARDTKVPSTEQIFLGECLNNDELYVKNVYSPETTLFVFKKGVFINRETFTVPKHIQWLFTNMSNTFPWREIRQIYAKSLFFLTQEQKLLMDGVVRAFQMYLGYLDTLNLRLKHELEELNKKTAELLIKVNCYYNLRVNNFVKLSANVSKFKDLCESQKLFYQIVQEFSAIVDEIKGVGGEAYNLINRKGLLDKFLPKIQPILDKCDLKIQIAGVKALLAKGSSQEHSCLDITKLVADAIKKKDKLLNNKYFQGYHKACSVAIRDAYDMLIKINNYIDSIDQLSKRIEENQKRQQSILVSSCLSWDSSDFLGNLNSDVIIQENRELRCEFEETLTKLFVDHKENVTHLNRFK